MQSEMGQLHVASSRPAHASGGFQARRSTLGVERASLELLRCCEDWARSLQQLVWQGLRQAKQRYGRPAKTDPAQPQPPSDMPNRHARAMSRFDNWLSSPWIGVQQQCRLVQRIGIVQPPSPTPIPAAWWANRQLAIPGGRQGPACLLPLPTCDPDLLVSVAAGQHTGASMERRPCGGPCSGPCMTMLRWRQPPRRPLHNQPAHSGTPVLPHLTAPACCLWTAAPSRRTAPNSQLALAPLPHSSSHG